MSDTITTVTLRLKEKLMGRITIEAPIEEFLQGVQFIFPDEALIKNMKRGRLYSWGVAAYNSYEQAAFIVKLTESPTEFLTTKKPVTGDYEVLVVMTAEYLMKWLKTETVPLDQLSN